MLTNPSMVADPSTDRAERWAFFALAATVASLAFSISLFELFSCATILLSVLSLMRRRSGFFGDRTLFWLACLYFIANVLSLTQSQHLADSLKGLFRISRLILLAWSGAYLVSSDIRLRSIVRWATFIAFFVAVDGCVQALTGFDLIRGRGTTILITGTNRITGPFKHPNDFAAYLSLAFFLFTGPLLEKQGSGWGKWRLFCLAGVLLSGFCLIKTYSRGAWVAVAVSFFVLAIIRRHRAALAGLVCAILFMLFFSPPLLKERVRSLFDPQNGTIVERRVLFEESIEMVRNSPFFGLGLNTYSDNAPLYKSKKIVTDVQYAHNGYVQMAAEIGVVGLATFLLFLIYFFISTTAACLARPLTPGAITGQGILAGLFSFLIHSATDTNLHSVLLIGLLWTFLGLGMATRNLRRRV